MESLLFLNTRNSSTNLTYNPSWNLSNAVQFRNATAFSMAFVSAEFANTVYPINAYNNKLYFTDTTTRTATVPVNNYTGTQLATELQTQMNAESTTNYTVTFDSQSKKITITGDASFIITDGAYNMNEELGIEYFTAGTTMVGDNPINLSGTAFVDVLINVSTSNFHSGNYQNVLTRIPVNGNFGDVVYYQAPQIMEMMLYDGTLDNIYCQLRDDKGNLWTLPSNSHLSLTLKLTVK